MIDEVFAPGMTVIAAPVMRRKISGVPGEYHSEPN